MYKIIYMKADYEPWWQFEDWRDYVISEYLYDDKQAAKMKLNCLLQEFSAKYYHKRQNKERFWAFWSENESAFCEQCSDVAQVYHGLIWEEI